MPATVANGVRVQADGIGIRTKRGGVFRDVSFSVRPGEVLAVCGSGGSGRTSLLLAISGRMRLSEGTLAIDSRRLPGAGPWVRRNSSVCPAPTIDPLVENMRVSEELRRAELFAGPRWRRDITRDGLLDLVGFSADQHDLISDLGPVDQSKLRLALGMVVTAPLVVLDDLGDQVPASGHDQLWCDVRACAQATGATIVASSLEPLPARLAADTFVALAGAHITEAA